MENLLLLIIAVEIGALLAIHAADFTKQRRRRGVFSPVKSPQETLSPGLVEILNPAGHCIGRRPAGHPDLEWAKQRGLRLREENARIS